VAPLYVGESLDYADDYMAQTFTTHNSGQIVSIGVQVFIDGYLNSRDGITDGIHLQLAQTNSAGDPDLTKVLATWVINASDVPLISLDVPITSTDLSPYSVNVNAGDQLAIVMTTSYLRSTHPEYRNYEWMLGPMGDVLPGGKFSVYSPETFGAQWFYMWHRTDPTYTEDAAFQVLVNVVPEPSTIALAVLGLALLSTRRRKSVPHNRV
jgi:hypothetical protein